MRAKGLAEAEAIGKRAEALAAESEAVIGQQIADKLPQIVEAAAGAFKGVDNLTVLNGAQGISEIMNQIVGQAGPTLRLAKQALGSTEHGAPANGKREPEAAPKPAPDSPPPPAAA